MKGILASGIRVKALERRPVLDPKFDVVFYAFRMLETSRIGLSGILLSEIKTFCDLFSIEDVEWFIRMIQEVDHHFLLAIKRSIDG